MSGPVKRISGGFELPGSRTCNTNYSEGRHLDGIRKNFLHITHLKNPLLGGEGTEGRYQKVSFFIFYF